MERQSYANFLAENAIYFFPLVFFVLLSCQSVQMDFRVFYLAGKSVLMHLDPYINHVDKGIGFFAPVTANNSYASGFKYPPFAAILFSSLAHFSNAAAKLLFALMSIVGFSLVCYNMQQLNKSKLNGIVILFLASSMPMAACLLQGQADLFMLMLVVLSFLLLVNYDNSRLSALVLSFAISLKMLPLFLLPIFFIKRYYKFCFYTVVFLLMFNAFPLLIMGTAPYKHFLMMTFPSIFGHLNNYPVVITSQLAALYKLSIIKRGFIVSFWAINGHLNVFRHHQFIAFIVGFILQATYFLYDKQHSFRYKFLASLILLNIFNPLAWLQSMVWYFPFVCLNFSRSNRLGKLCLVLPIFLPAQLLASAYLSLGLLFTYATPRFTKYLLLKQ